MSAIRKAGDDSILRDYSRTRSGVNHFPSAGFMSQICVCTHNTVEYVIDEVSTVRFRVKMILPSVRVHAVVDDRRVLTEQPTSRKAPGLLDLPGYGAPESRWSRRPGLAIVHPDSRLVKLKRSRDTEHERS